MTPWSNIQLIWDVLDNISKVVFIVGVMTATIKFIHKDKALNPMASFVMEGIFAALFGISGICLILTLYMTYSQDFSLKLSDYTYISVFFVSLLWSTYILGKSSTID